MPLILQHNKYYLLWIFSASRHLSLGTTCHRVTQLCSYHTIADDNNNRGAQWVPKWWVFFSLFYFMTCQQFQKGTGEMGRTTWLGLETRSQGTCFFLFLVFYLFTNYFLGSNYVLNNRGVQGRTATTITGPNDASGVVWALGIFFSCFNRLTISFCCI